MKLEGKVAVITGGASGIGAATAKLFVENGAKVVIGDIQDEVGERFAASLDDHGTFRHCNVAREDQVAALIAAATGTWGRLDVMYNNAGFVGAVGPFESTSVDDYDLTMDVLLKSVFLGIKYASPIMKQQGSGSIISTASICGLVPDVGTHLYNVAKAGVIMMTKSAALEMAEQNIRVNCICPGFIATQLAAGRSLSDTDDAENAERLGRHCPNGAVPRERRFRVDNRNRPGRGRWTYPRQTLAQAAPQRDRPGRDPDVQTARLSLWRLRRSRMGTPTPSSFRAWRFGGLPRRAAKLRGLSSATPWGHRG